MRPLALATLLFVLAPVAVLDAQEAGPEEAARQFMEAYQHIDLPAMSRHLADPTLKDVLAFYQLKVEDAGDRRRDLFAFRDNKLWSLQLVEVDWHRPHTLAQVGFCFYVSETELNEPSERVGFVPAPGGPRFFSVWQHVRLTLTQVGSRWLVVEMTGDFAYDTPKSRESFHPFEVMTRVLSQKRQ